jgi:DNA-directed RNA polymerase specialized sigma24 family protein
MYKWTVEMINPLTKKYAQESDDEGLVHSARNGSREALESLVRRHQAWIYNIALRMVWHPQDAEDVTQEILIKMITRLATFKGNSSFRTWLYRIVTNHVMNMKKARSERLFIVTHTVGSEILGISKDHFRQILSRARRQLFNFMNQKCGLIDSRNSCHCRLKTAAMIDSGSVDPHNLLFSARATHKIKGVTEKKLKKLQGLFDQKCRELFGEHPFQNSPDFVRSLRDILDGEDFHEFLSQN